MFVDHHPHIRVICEGLYWRLE